MLSAKLLYSRERGSVGKTGIFITPQISPTIIFKCFLSGFFLALCTARIFFLNAAQLLTGPWSGALSRWDVSLRNPEGSGKKKTEAGMDATIGALGRAGQRTQWRSTFQDSALLQMTGAGLQQCFVFVHATTSTEEVPSSEV